jgi:hypothetical protein
MSPEERKHAAEQWLDEALAHHNAPPRAGLENRIVSHLQAYDRQQQRRWIFVLAATAAAAILAIVAAELPHAQQKPLPPTQAQARGAGTHQANATATPRQSVNAETVQAQTPVAHKNTDSENTTANAATLQSAQKQREFPAGKLPSEQARLLQAYLRQTPARELALVAEHQQSAGDINIPDLSIPHIEIQALSPETNDMDLKGER